MQPRIPFLFSLAYNEFIHPQDYVDLGSTYFDERDRQAVQRQLVRRLEAWGFKVTVEPTTPAA